MMAVTEPRRSPVLPSRPGTGGSCPGLFTVEETARRVGHYKWIEMRLFEALGGWVATVPELDVKMRLGTHCYHHAWHAELWNKRLPELREMNTERLTLPPNDGMEAFVDAMSEPEAPEHDDREARRRLPRADPAHDRGVHVPPEQHVADHRRARRIRSLKFTLQDEFEDWRDGEMLIQSLIETHDEVERAGRPSRSSRSSCWRRRHRRSWYNWDATGASVGGGISA